ncbi:hypothetical protein HTT03_11810 [Sulfitobacter sp. S0837]|uniref:hypothetical protein n=1 Tax=Sulfitobacter maritimus TaxID=2741719 RepID=UPI001581C3E1|nr:hypothetical protein [Sulfitobacter maritimus]NUH65970.1 hypothetical protein [Sulfitobacter maritimus]
MNRLFFWGVLALGLAALAAGFAVVGGPEHARAERRDDTRRADLRRIAQRVICERDGQADFTRACREAGAARDPLTGAEYDLEQSENTFAVCATFEVPPQEGAVFRREPLDFDGTRGCLRYRLVPRSGQWVVQER